MTAHNGEFSALLFGHTYQYNYSTPPEVAIVEPAPNITTNDNTPQLVYSVNEGIVTVKVDGVTVSKVSGQSLDPLTDGQHTIRVESIDVDGNTGFDEVTLIVDATPPVLTPSHVSGSFDTPFNLSFQANEEAVIRYTTDGTLPTVGGIVYTSPISITVSTKVYAMATDMLANNSNIVELNFEKIENGSEAVPSSGSNSDSSTETVAPKETVLLQGEGVTASLKTVTDKLSDQEVRARTMDIPSGHWAGLVIKEAVSTGIFSGTGNSFEPERGCTRAEFITVILNGLDITGGEIKTFEFTDSEAIPQWAASKLNIAKSLDLISGYPDGSIRPNQLITRAEAAVILNMLAARWPTEAAGFKLEFSDELPAWSEQSIKKMNEMQIVRGYPNGSFQANKVISRAETAVMIVRLLEKLKTTL